MAKLLTLKHWQLFVLLFGLPIIIQVTGIVAVVSGKSPAIMIFSFPLVMILFIGVYFGWIYSLATKLNNRLPGNAGMKLARFKLFSLFPLAYIFLICLFMFGLFNNLWQVPGSPIKIFAIILPLHLFSIFCIFYCLHFTAKSLKIVELQRPVSFSDFAGEFVLMWFFPIGVWVIQPRVNRLFGGPVSPEITDM